MSEMLPDVTVTVPVHVLGVTDSVDGTADGDCAGSASVKFTLVKSTLFRFVTEMYNVAFSPLFILLTLYRFCAVGATSTESGTAGAVAVGKEMPKDVTADKENAGFT